MITMIGSSQSSNSPIPDLLDSRFAVEILSKTDRPNLLCYLAMHQDYSENFVAQELDKLASYSEAELGNRLVNHCIKYNHWGVCYDEETEVLTEKGFKFWSEITNEDLLYAVEPDTGLGHYEKPQSLIKLDYEGEMICIEHKRVNLCVTPDHKLFVKTRRNSQGEYSNLYPIKASDVFGRQYKVSCQTFLNNNERKKIDFTNEELSVIGFWLGDGVKCTNKKETQNIKFHVRLSRKIAFLKSLNCKQINAEYFIYENSKLALFLHEKCVDETGNKILPDCLLNIPYDQFLFLSDGLSQSDGTHRTSRLSYDYSTSHKPLAKKLYLLFLLNGLAVKEYIERHSEKNTNWRDNYRLIIHPNSEFRIEKKQQTKSFYKGKVYCAKVSTGALLIRRKSLPLICGNCEHPSITFNVINFPHSVMVQARTHRVGVSFDCQSQRYTSQRIIELAEKLAQLEQQSTPEERLFKLIEDVFYFRAIGDYFDREGNKYCYSEKERNQDILFTKKAIEFYADKVKNGGYAPEHARDTLTQNIRQHFVVTFNARSLLHFCDLRLPKDAQSEIRNLASLIFQHFETWMPEVAEVYRKKRLGKNLLAP